MHSTENHIVHDASSHFFPFSALAYEEITYYYYYYCMKLMWIVNDPIRIAVFISQKLLHLEQKTCLYAISESLI